MFGIQAFRLVILAGLLIAYVSDASAAPAGHSNCSGGFSFHRTFPEFTGNKPVRTIADLRRQLGPRAGRKAWGLEENVHVVRDAAVGGPFLVVHLPKGSINPRNASAPLGGMGWRWTPMSRSLPSRACLHYRVMFDRSFAFQRGGKLPGLFGGDAPAGGRTTDGSTGFSLRLMWRSGGAGEVYAYVPGHPGGRGRSIRRGAWWFPRGRWTDIAQEVVLNTPGFADGAVRVWIDGSLRLEARNLVIRTNMNVGVSGVMGDVFYGGKTRSWAAPRDTEIRFSAFKVQW